MHSKWRSKTSKKKTNGPRTSLSYLYKNPLILISQSGFFDNYATQKTIQMQLQRQNDEIAEFEDEVHRVLNPDDLNTATGILLSERRPGQAKKHPISSQGAQDSGKQQGN
jgi:hypothetical protein